MHTSILHTPGRFRVLLMLASIALAALLTACANTPPPPPPPPAPVVVVVPARTTALVAMGFEKTDEGFVLNLPGPLLFDTGSDVLSSNAKIVLAKLATDLRLLEINTLRLFGHTDTVGSAEFNKNLSTKRAEAVAQAMLGEGFVNDRLERRGFGFERPLASNDTPEGRTKNRRVAVIVPFE
jgi:outer membrane protein OmpA-like peptidoglycan-associated protein